MKCKKKIKEDELHLKKERNRKRNARKKGILFLNQCNATTPENKNCAQPKKKRVFLFV